MKCFTIVVGESQYYRILEIILRRVNEDYQHLDAFVIIGKHGTYSEDHYTKVKILGTYQFLRFSESSYTSRYTNTIVWKLKQTLFASLRLQGAPT